MSDFIDNKSEHRSDDKEHENYSESKFVKGELNGKESEQVGENAVFIERTEFSTKGLETEVGKRSALYEFRHDVNFRHRLLHSGCVSLGMISLGWRSGLVGPTFPDLRLIIDEDLSTSSWVLMAISLGGLIGSLCGGTLYDKTNKLALFLCLYVVFGSLTAVTPWCSNLPAMIVVHLLQGLTHSAIDSASTADTMFVWGGTGGQYLQAVHFGFSLGAIISPLTCEPFLASRQLVDSSARYTNSTAASIENLSNASKASLLSTSAAPIAFESFIVLNERQTTDKQFVVNDSSPFKLSNPVTNTSNVLVYEYGTTQVYKAYLIAMAVSLCALFLFAVLNIVMGSVYSRPRPKITKTKKTNNEKRNVSTKTKVVFVILLSTLLMTYNMSERHFVGFLVTFVVSFLGWSKANGSTLTSSFWIALALGRLLGVVAFKFTKTSLIMAVFLAILLVGGIGFWLSIVFDKDVLIWISVIVLGFGKSVIFTSCFSWLSEKVVPITGKIASIAYFCSLFGAMCLPILAGFLMNNVSFMWFVYIEVIMIVLMVLIFCLSEIVYRAVVTHSK